MKHNLSFSNSEIIDIIKNDNRRQNAVLYSIYKNNAPQIRNFIVRNSGSVDDANDVIQDAVLLLYEKIRKDHIDHDVNISGYLYQMGKYLWYNKKRKDAKKVPLTQHNLFPSQGYDTSADFENPEKLKIAFLKEVLAVLGEDCRRVLIDSIYKKIPMQEIAINHGFKNEQVARNKKFKCLRCLRKKIEASPRLKKMLEEMRGDF